LSKNKLKSIETEAFKQLKKLKVLDLAENPIEKFNGQDTNKATYQDLIVKAMPNLDMVDNLQTKI